MNDYRLIQIQELAQKIEEAKALLADPSMAEMAQEEIQKLEEEKCAIESTMEDKNGPARVSAAP